MSFGLPLFRHATGGALASLLLLGVASSALAFNQSPMLDDLVKAGKLPPVDQRLPEKPQVIDVFGEVGTYGGTLHRAYKGIGDRWGTTKLMEERVVKFMQDADGKTVLKPRFIESYTVNDNSTEFTFKLLKGLRWSDGEPVTTDDVRFWYEDVFLNTDLTPNIPSTLMADGKPLVVAIKDAQTFTVSFAKPYALFPEIVAKDGTGKPGLDRTSFLVPAHYMKKYHPKYVSADELAKIAADKGVKTWVDLWGEKGPIQSWWLNPDYPVITAYRMVTPPPADTIVMERNPYYWAVDKAGNQLPYIDKIESKVFQDQQAMNLMIVQGQIDMQSRFVQATDFPLYKQNEAKGGYRVEVSKGGENVAVMPNIASADPIKNKLFNDPKFREALSIAVDRSAINEVVYSGLTTPRQAAPVSASPFFDKDFAAKWVKFDKKKANALLDEIGLTKKDGKFRLGPDGKRLSFTLEAVQDDLPVQTLELLRKNWEAIGVEILIRIEQEDMATQKFKNGDFDLFYTYADRMLQVSADPTLALGHESYAENYYKWWNTKGADGVEPPKDHPIRKIWADWEAAAGAPTLDEAHKHVQDIITDLKDQVYMIGLVGEGAAPVIVNAKLGNFPKGFTNEEVLRNEGNFQPAQLYFKK